MVNRGLNGLRSRRLGFGGFGVSGFGLTGFGSSSFGWCGFGVSGLRASDHRGFLSCAQDRRPTRRGSTFLRLDDVVAFLPSSFHLSP
jgi:hypothetical protein